jgi:hypothetical protein
VPAQEQTGTATRRLQSSRAVYPALTGQTLDRQPVGVPMVLEPAANDLTKLSHKPSLHRQNGARVKANCQRAAAASQMKFRKLFSGGCQPLRFVFRPNSEAANRK